MLKVLSQRITPTRLRPTLQGGLITASRSGPVMVVLESAAPSGDPATVDRLVEHDPLRALRCSRAGSR